MAGRRNWDPTFQRSHTFMGHPLACAAALAMQRVIRRDNLLANVRSQGAYLARRLHERFGNQAQGVVRRGRVPLSRTPFIDPPANDGASAVAALAEERREGR
jgi:hypothetical protein